MKGKTICMADLKNVQLDGIYMEDYPEFPDAFVRDACWRSTGIPLTDQELERIDKHAIGALALLIACEA